MKKPYNYISLTGKWDVKDDIFENSGPIDEKTPQPFGLLLFDKLLMNGSFKAVIEFKKNIGSCARLVIGYDPKTKEYYSIGIGGYNFAYVIDKYTEGLGWRGLELSGYQQKIEDNKKYIIELKLIGQRIKFKVNDIIIFDSQLPEPLSFYQTGLFTWGKGIVKFSNIEIQQEKAKAFVIMEFKEPFESLYEEVIKKVCEDVGLYVYKADEVFQPGFILKDIIEGILESDIIIADITPPNPNVFYELGYSHALGKPTILLAQRESRLPFDVSGFRVIFYDNTIKGKGEVENNLRNHLNNIIKQ